MKNIYNFNIEKLHGYHDIKLEFKENNLILVGENGAGKTTVLRMLFYVLTGQWTSLSKYKFISIELKIGNNTFKLKYSDVQKNITHLDEKYLRRLPPPVRYRIQDLLIKGDSNLTMREIERICERYGVPFHYVIRDLDLFDNPKITSLNKNIVNFSNSVQESIDSTILYLPTYRRIEQELGLILKDIDEDDLRAKRGRRYLPNTKKSKNFIELIEFGMRDVDEAITSTLDQLKEWSGANLYALTLGYLGDVVDEKYTQVNISQIQKASDNTITNVLNRIDKNILSEESKQHLSLTIDNVRKGNSPDYHTKVICHYFLKLLNFQQELEEKEQKIRKFCDVCNKYMSKKTFIYDSAKFEFSIFENCIDGKQRRIQIHQLSSGEKQIVSLFSHLYLSSNEKYFVMIDEPELSLSVPWQREFLTDIRNGSYCIGIFAVTHSPFIYDNELKKFAHGFGEFTKVNKR